MKKIYRIYSLFLISCTISYAQVLDKTANQKLVTNHESLAEKQLKENIYIHTDKDIYSPGEEVWFKAYILQANDLKISRNTSMVFVELIQQHENHEGHENHGDVLVQEIYTAANGFANGHLPLARTLEDGTYKLVFHTKNTLENSSKKILATKEIEINGNNIPKILIDTEFSKKSYHRSDEIILDIHTFSRSRLPYIDAVITADVYDSKKKIGRVKLRTNEKGTANIVFLPQKTKNAEYIKLRVQYKDETAYHTVEIPFENPAAIQFGMYPEGGNLIENLPNTIAFKAIDHRGKPLAVKGVLYENGKKLTAFKAAHFGMGKFLFTPKPSKKYTVQLLNLALDSVFQLPVIQKSGMKLQVTRSNQKNIQFSITKTDDVTLEKVYIRAQSRGNVYWMATASLTKDRIQFKIPWNKLPQGITEVTIFNKRFQPLAERLIYGNLNQKLHIELKEMSKSIYKQKDKVDVTFSVKDEQGKPAIGHFSLSVFDHLQAKKDNNYAMLPHYYLFSELKGHVYNASYYFDDNNKKRDQHLDLLLLTQGWRNYTWNSEDLLQHHDVIKPFNELVKGRAFETKKGKIVKNAKGTEIQVILPKMILSLITDHGGNFTLPLDYQRNNLGSRIFFIPTDEAEIMLDITFPFDEISNRKKSKEIYFPKNDQLLAEKKQSSYNTSFSFTETNFLDEVQLTGFKKRPKEEISNEYYLNKPEKGIGDYVCYIADVLNCISCLSGYAPEEGKYYYTGNGYTQLYVKPPPLILPDENFIIAYGFHPTKEFYIPTYDQKEKDIIPDYRKTLFWSPNLISNDKGEINVSFYTSDIQSTFFGKLEGTNGNGLLGATSFQFNVN